VPEIIDSFAKNRAFEVTNIKTLTQRFSNDGGERQVKCLNGEVIDRPGLKNKEIP